jgi:hypothetical protein
VREAPKHQSENILSDTEGAQDMESVTRFTACLSRYQQPTYRRFIEIHSTRSKRKIKKSMPCARDVGVLIGFVYLCSIQTWATVLDGRLHGQQVDSVGQWLSCIAPQVAVHALLRDEPRGALWLIRGQPLDKHIRPQHTPGVKLSARCIAAQCPMQPTH